MTRIAKIRDALTAWGWAVTFGILTLISAAAPLYFLSATIIKGGHERFRHALWATLAGGTALVVLTMIAKCDVSGHW